MQSGRRPGAKRGCRDRLLDAAGRASDRVICRRRIGDLQNDPEEPERGRGSCGCHKGGRTPFRGSMRKDEPQQREGNQRQRVPGLRAEEKALREREEKQAEGNETPPRVAGCGGRDGKRNRDDHRQPPPPADEFTQPEIGGPIPSRGELLGRKDPVGELPEDETVPVPAREEQRFPPPLRRGANLQPRGLLGSLTRRPRSDLRGPRIRDASKEQRLGGAHTERTQRQPGRATDESQAGQPDHEPQEKVDGPSSRFIIREENDRPHRCKRIRQVRTEQRQRRNTDSDEDQCDLPIRCEEEYGCEPERRTDGERLGEHVVRRVPEGETGKKKQCGPGRRSPADAKTDRENECCDSGGDPRRIDPEQPVELGVGSAGGQNEPEEEEMARLGQVARVAVSVRELTRRNPFAKQHEVGRGDFEAGPSAERAHEVEAADRRENRCQKVVPWLNVRQASHGFLRRDLSCPRPRASTSPGSRPRPLSPERASLSVRGACRCARAEE